MASWRMFYPSDRDRRSSYGGNKDDDDKEDERIRRDRLAGVAEFSLRNGLHVTHDDHPVIRTNAGSNKSPGGPPDPSVLDLKTVGAKRVTRKPEKCTDIWKYFFAFIFRYL